jgi:hypothetical protein
MEIKACEIHLPKKRISSCLGIKKAPEPKLPLASPASGRDPPAQALLSATNVGCPTAHFSLSLFIHSKKKKKKKREKAREEEWEK